MLSSSEVNSSGHNAASPTSHPSKQQTNEGAETPTPYVHRSLTSSQQPAAVSYQLTYGKSYHRSKLYPDFIPGHTFYYNIEPAVGTQMRFLAKVVPPRLFGSLKMTLYEGTHPGSTCLRGSAEIPYMGSPYPLRLNGTTTSIQRPDQAPPNSIYVFDIPAGTDVHPSRSRPKGAKTLMWQRTRLDSDGVTRLKKLWGRHYRLTEMDSGKLLAVFLREFDTVGRLDFVEPAGSELQTWAVLSCLTLFEKKRWHKRKRSTGGGGGM